MKLLIFSDIHNDLRTLESHMATEADYYFAAGDLVSWAKGIERCGEILKARGDKVYVMPGNHESAAQVERMCESYGLHFFHGRSMQLGAWHIAGLGYSSPTPFHTPGEYGENEIERRLEPFAELAPLVLICHAPPYGSTLDRIRDGLHGGSTAVRDFLASHQPAYFFCGHIHEAAGVRETIGTTQAANVGKQGYLLELEVAPKP
jgi:Icc-related predicted phosphoesterase